MFRVLSCLLIEHDPRYVACAALLCVVGTFLTVRLFARVRRGRGVDKVIWLFLAGFVGGSTTWTTHFLAMLGYLGGGQATYDPALTFWSFLIAVMASIFGLGIASYGGRSAVVEAGGAVMGLGIAAMHYTGMSAYVVQGVIEWDRDYVFASLVFAALFGALITSRVVRPVTRFCRYGSMFAMILAITATHFTGMGAINVLLDLQAAVPSNGVPAVVLGFGVLSLMLILLALTAATYLLDARTAKAAVEQYRHLSLHDPLTGLSNRAAFNEHLQEIEAYPADPTARTAVLSFDLNRFKEINDVHGHAAGDAVLRTIGGRLMQVTGEGEFICRVGGDEFVAVKRRYYRRSDAMLLANRLLAEICKPIEWNGNRLAVGSSVGIALYPGEAKTIDDLVAQADVAMYRAKKTGDNTICFYDSSMDQAVRERNALAMDMRSGLVAGQFELYYQLQNDTFTGDVIGFEVLLRWNHPERGQVSPSEFIPIAERTGFICELGEWVLRSACAEAARWRNPLGIAVNVASQQLADPNFPLKVLAILEETGLDPNRLEIEVTESGIIADHQRALQTIRHLKSLGVRIAMDDYGTGYSSLSTLMTFPFDKIKIDRTFVDGLAVNSHSAAIVRSTLILASSLDIPVLAEGVETDEHMAFLRKEGCTQVQGFLFGKPGPRAGIEHIVNAGLGEIAAKVA